MRTPSPPSGHRRPATSRGTRTQTPARPEDIGPLADPSIRSRWIPPNSTIVGSVRRNVRSARHNPTNVGFEAADGPLDATNGPPDQIRGPVGSSLVKGGITRGRAPRH